MTKRAVLHIPHPEMLVKQSVAYWIERFERSARRPPDEVVLPGVGFLGPMYDSQVHWHMPDLSPDNLLPKWVADAHARLGANTPVWVSIIPGYSFLEVKSVMLKDQYGVRFNQACIANPTVQRVTDTFIGEMAEFGISGVVFDLTDAYPNSGSDAVIGIQNTCFCSYCLRDLENEGWTEKARLFFGPENITRFVLRITATGADHLEPRHEWLESLDTASLIRISEARGFVTKDNNSADDAEKVLRYLRIRARTSARSIKRMGHIARDERQLRTAVILGDESLDMTQLTDLETLVKEEAASEYWLPAVDADVVARRGISALQYLSGRASYVINAFFEALATASETIGASNVSFFIERLLRTSNTMTRSNQLSPGAVFAVSLQDEFQGFVGVPIGQTELVDFIEALTEKTLGQVVPRNIIDQIISQVRLTTPGLP